MKKQEQTKFVKDLTKAIRDQLLADIKAGRVPAEWDGIELRWLLAERFTNASRFGNSANNPRKRDFDNTVLVNNL